MLTQLLIVTSSLALTAATAQAQLCGEWNLVPTPNPGAGGNALNDIAASGGNDAWAVGSAGLGAPLLLTFDGKDWQHITMPATASLGTLPKIDSVTIEPGGDVWLLGAINTTYPMYNLPLALRYRNGSFDRVETMTLRPQTVYPYAARGGFAYAAHAFAANDVWAVGTAAGFGDAAATSVPLAAHFDGSSWTDVPTPVIANRSHALTDVHGTSGSDVWAVGYSRNVADVYRARILHFDGSSWSQVPNPAESIAQSFLYAVVALGPDDVWAAGSINYSAPLLMHYDGAAWSVVSTPAGTPAVEIGALAANSADSVWASLGSQDVMLHFDGASWSLVSAPPLPAGMDSRSVRALAAIDACDVWAAGVAFNSVGCTYTARLQTANGRPGDINQDGYVNVVDLLTVINAWGACPAPPAACPADINSDTIINVSDLLMVINNWG